MTGMRSFVVELAKTGGKIARDYFTTVSGKDVRTKTAHDYVSHADGIVEDAIIRRIRAHYPDHQIMGEETAADEQPVAGQPCWIIDPIDGTTNFIHGLPMFAVSIAFCDEQGLHTGVVHNPIANEVFLAERGLGVWLNNEAAQTSGCKELAKALVATALPFRCPAMLDDFLAVLGDVQRHADDHRRCGSAALDLAYTAVGRLDGYYEIGIYPWDTAAGELLVRCAGGAATDWRGHADRLAERRSIVAAATPALHAELLARLAPLAAWLDRPPFAGPA